MIPYSDSEIDEILELEVYELLGGNHKKSESVTTIELEGGGVSYTFIEPEECGDLLSMEEKERIAEENIRLIHFMANKFKVDNYNLNMDDIVSVANVAFVKALNAYKKSYCMPFSTFACTCIHNEICSFLTSEDRRGGRTNLSLDADVSVNDYVSSASYSCIGKDDESLDIAERDMAAEDLIDLVNDVIDEALDPKEQFIVKSYYGFDGFEKKNQMEIAVILHVSQPAVLKKLKGAKQKLKKILKYKYNIRYLEDIL